MRYCCLVFLIWMVVQGVGGRVVVAQGPPERCTVQTDRLGAFGFLVDGRQRTVWNGKTDAKRPFFFPVVGPSGQSVTRMGHPGAPDHDHHCSVWFAHFKVNGLDFWSENGETRIVQREWLAQEDGASACRMAVLLDWIGPTQAVVMQQRLVAELTPLEHGESLLEVQSDFTPSEGSERVTFDKTNFGLLAVRVSKTISNVFGYGRLTSDSGGVGETNIFQGRHRWVDYSGQSPVFHDGQHSWFEEGITYFDHPTNRGFPNGWHVRNDGWMCASPTMFEGCTVTHANPLRVRYLLHVHAGAYDSEVAEGLFSRFSASSSFRIERSKVPHVRYSVSRDKLLESDASDIKRDEATEYDDN